MRKQPPALLTDVVAATQYLPGIVLNFSSLLQTGLPITNNSDSLLAATIPYVKTHMHIIHTEVCF